MSTELSTPASSNYVFSNAQAFENGQRMAKLLSQSTMVPSHYHNNMPNCLIGLEIAQRMKASPLMILQNLYVIQGRPSWSSAFLISTINECGKFQALQYEIKDLGEKTVKNTKIHDFSCTAWAIEKATNQKVYGPTVTIEMAVLEGWYTKSGSKWQTMPQLMLRYRAAAFFARTICPELTMGLQTQEEAADIIDVTPQSRYRKKAAPLQEPEEVGEVIDMDTGEVTEIVQAPVQKVNKVVPPVVDPARKKLEEIKTLYWSAKGVMELDKIREDNLEHINHMPDELIEESKRCFATCKDKLTNPKYKTDEIPTWEKPREQEVSFTQTPA